MNSLYTLCKEECPSYTHFSNTPYTLSFGHLLSGNFNSCINEQSKCYSNCLNNIQIQENQYRINEVMKNIRKNIKKSNCLMPSVPYCYNPIMNNSNQNNITKATVLLERAANAMSIVGQKQKRF